VCAGLVTSRPLAAWTSFDLRDELARRAVEVGSGGEDRDVLGVRAPGGGRVVDHHLGPRRDVLPANGKNAAGSGGRHGSDEQHIPA
jgi:hypothetical protein